MGISLNTQHLKRYRDIAWLFMKYGRSDLVKGAGLEQALLEEERSFSLAETPKAEELATDLEKLGPTFIKLGQLLSTRADILQEPYLSALARLQNNVEPFPYEEVERIIHTELGVRISKAFLEFDPIPMAAASLGQVHRGTLRDGTLVAVKVQRPDIRERIIEDLEALEEVAVFLDRHTDMGHKYEFQNMLIELRKSLLGELDYRQEASNLTRFAANLQDYECLVIPQPINSYTSSKVLTMQYIRGRKITSITPLGRMELDGPALAEELFQAYLQQMLVDGFFHADPHPGNVLLTEDNRIALLDLGMVSRMMPGLQENMLHLLLAISEGHGEEAAERAIKCGEPKIDFAEPVFRREVAALVMQNYHAGLDRLNAGRVVLEITRISGANGFRLPPEFTMMAKTLLNLDQVVAALDPEFSPNASIRRHAMELMAERMQKSVSMANILSSLLETKDFVQKLPSRVNKILDRVADNNLELKVDAIDEKVLMEGLQKVANRITMGLILAALIIGAALLMRVETSFRILGYPGMAIIFFLMAAGGGLALIGTILFNDEKADK